MPDGFCPSGKFIVMGNSDYRQSLPVQFFKQPENRLGIGCIEISRRFVGKKQPGIIDQSTGDRHPLHLAAG